MALEELSNSVILGFYDSEKLLVISLMAVRMETKLQHKLIS